MSSFWRLWKKQALNVLRNWFDTNKLSLNLNKTKYIIFSTKQIKQQVKIIVNSIEIERVYETKFLGVIIHEKLCWKSHIENVKRKISKIIGILYKTKDILNKASLYILYCSLLLPYLTYGVEIWGHTYKTNTQSIFKLQKRAIRIINHSSYIQPTNPLFIKLNTLKFHDLVEFKTAQIMYKAYNNQLCHSIQKLFKIREGCYRLRGTSVFQKTRTRTNIKQMCVSSKGVNLWNNYEIQLKSCESFSVFKKKFKI